MPTRFNWLATLFCALTLPFAVIGAQPPGPPADADRLLRDHHQRVVNANATFQEIFGPLPAVAATPFLGLAAIAGAALLSEHPAVAGSASPIVQRVRRHALVEEAKTYASWWLFSALVFVGLASGVANAGKLQGALGKIVRFVENMAVGLAYCVIAAGALTAEHAASGDPQFKSHLVAAGIVPAMELSALALFVSATLALAAMMIIRFAIDFVIWLNPVPFIDLLFEGAKVLISAAFLGVYVLSPLLATALAVLVLLGCLFMLPWAARFVGFGYRILLCPLLGRVAPWLRPKIVEKALVRNSGGDNVELACRASVLKARGLKKRQAVAIVRTNSGMTTYPLWRKGRARGLSLPGEQLVLGRSLVWIELRVVDHRGETIDRFALPRSLERDLEHLASVLGASDVGHFGMMKLASLAGQAVKDGVEKATTSVRIRSTPSH